MAARRIWIAGYGGPPAAAIGAVPVWIAPGDGTVPSAVLSEIVSFFSPVAGATAVWIAGYFKSPPAAIGATPITISGWGGSGGGGGGVSTSVWSAADAAANGMTLSNGGLTVTPSGPVLGQFDTGVTTSKTSQVKYYVEFLKPARPGVAMFCWGWRPPDLIPSIISAIITTRLDRIIPLGWISGLSAGFTAVSELPWHTGPVSANDVFGLAIDFTAQAIWIAHNNVWRFGARR